MFSGSKYPKNILIAFEKGSTAHTAWSVCHYALIWNVQWVSYRSIWSSKHDPRNVTPIWHELFLRITSRTVKSVPLIDNMVAVLGHSLGYNFARNIPGTFSYRRVVSLVLDTLIEKWYSYWASENYVCKQQKRDSILRMQKSVQQILSMHRSGQPENRYCFNSTQMFL